MLSFCIMYDVSSSSLSHVYNKIIWQHFVYSIVLHYRVGVSRRGEYIARVWYKDIIGKLKKQLIFFNFLFVYRSLSPALTHSHCGCLSVMLYTYIYSIWYVHISYFRIISFPFLLNDCAHCAKSFWRCHALVYVLPIPTLPRLFTVNDIDVVEVYSFVFPSAALSSSSWSFFIAGWKLTVLSKKRKMIIKWIL